MMRKYKKKSNLVNSTGFTPGYASENNPINYIPSENITMRNTPYPVYGQPLDQNGMAMGNPTYMEPGKEYKFGGASYVAEVPAYKDGGQKSEWVSQKIGELMREGRPQKQAIAIAYSMWEQKHEMGGTQLPRMQDAGTWYQNNPAGFQPNFTGAPTQAPKVDGKFDFTANPQISPTLDLKLKGSEPWKYGLGANPNANALGIVPTDFSKNFPLPEGVSKPLPKDIGYKVPTAAEMAKGVQNATPSDGGATARENAGGSGITQFVNPYGDVGMEDALGFSGQQFAKGNTGMGIAGAALGALKGTKSFLQGMGAQKRQNQIMKGYAEDQYSNMSGEKREVAMGRRGGYFQYGGEEDMGYESDLIDKYPNSEATQAEIASRNPVFGPQEEPAGYSSRSEWLQKNKAAMESDYSGELAEVGQKSTSARDTWEQKTGMPWAEAKRLGYTSGTAQDNIKLLSELNDPRFKAENLRSKPLAGVPAKATPRKAEKKGPPTKTAKDFTYQDFQNAMKGKPKYSEKQSNIGVSDEGTMISRVGERLANPLQTFGHYAKYGEAPAEGFSKNSKNAYDQVLGVANPIYWANALGNSADYAGEGEYKKAAIEALDAAPLLGKLKYVRYLPLPGKVPGLAQSTSKGLQVVNKVGSAVGPARRAAPLRNYFTPELAAAAQNAQLGQGAVRIGQGAKRIGQGAPQTGQLSFGFGDGGFFQEGGMQSPMEEQQEGAMSNPQEEQGEIPQQGGGDQMQEVTQQVAQMLQQGADPQEILQQLVQAGIPQEQAQQIIQMIMEQMQGGQEATPQLGQGGQMMKRADGSYSKRGMWDNIRDNKGSGKRPTAEMLEQERKIKSKYQEGGEAMDEQMEGEDEGAEGETPSMEQIEGQVEQALKQGADPQQVLQQLVEMGIPEEQAVQMIQELLQEIQGGETEQEAPEQGQPMMKSGGEYLAALKGRTIKNYTYNKNTGNYDVEFE